jgi:urease accessory protein
MRRVRTVLAAGSWRSAEAVARVTLDCEDRQRRRLAMTDDGGEPFLLDLPRVAALKDGDGLVIEGGGIIAVKAAAEAVADLYADGAPALVRLAWHLGNRHAPIQLLADGGIRIRGDAVLVAMLEGLGARVVRRTAPFEPEAGAYAHGGAAPSAGHHHDSGAGGG